MNATVFVAGSGAREHCIAWKIAQSPLVDKVFVCPGNGGTQITNNPKISNLECNLKDLDAFVELCILYNVNLVIIGPEDLLARGICDKLSRARIYCFGPSQTASIIECDKSFAKDFMIRHQIPTARYETFKSSSNAKEYVKSCKFKPFVVKASGLASGKGVIICKDIMETCRTIELILDENLMGDAGKTIIIEEILEGEEVSLLAFTDGNSIKLMPLAQDHKRAYENDLGPNTGGMGAYCPYEVDALTMNCLTNIMQKAIKGLKIEDRKFVGVLYAGVMLTQDGPKVLEFNCRFGDPETQSLLPLLESDLYEICLACVNGTINTLNIKWSSYSACGVVIASKGYPSSPVIDVPITIKANPNLLLFHAGTKIVDGKLLTSGGRVITVVALGSNLNKAIMKAQNGANDIKIEGSFYRKDIGHLAIKRLNENRLSYKSSGVDIEAGNRLVEKIKILARNTNRAGVSGSIGSFGGIFDPCLAGFQDPLLVSSTDGVGTKLKIAIQACIYDTVGIDLVAMCVNDVLATGAEPLFFLDYFACGKLDVDKTAKVIEGITIGCKQAGCSLIGGETAEMPGMYSDEDFDLAGFCVGAVDRDSVLPKIDLIQEGDLAIGLPSNGVHSNGFSLVRSIIAKKGLSLSDRLPNETSTLSQILLNPTRIYIKSVIPAIRLGYILAAAHITGGGLLENIPRVLPSTLSVDLDASQWSMPPIFKWIAKEGNIEKEEMLRTFNCGIGMVLIVRPENAQPTLQVLRSHGERGATIIGQVVSRPDRLIRVRNFESLLSAKTLVTANKKRVAVLISGTGSNLQALIDVTTNKTRNSSSHIVLVISNMPGVLGLERAKNAGIETAVVSHKGYKNRVDYDMILHKLLTQFQVDIVCLAGFMRILSPEFVSLWKGNLINIHPSLLPVFKGINTHEQALLTGVRVHGCTVHFVDNGVDTGAIILQEAVPVLLGDTPSILQERVKQAEHRIYPMALEYVASGKVSLSSTGKAVWKF